MTITIIAAIAQDGGIGYKSKLPWPRIPAELAHFHQTVNDMVMVCGVNTYPTLPKGLRQQTLVWSERAWKLPTYDTGTIVEMSTTTNVAIIGGAATYAAFMPYAGRLVLSHIDGAWPADTYFPMLEVWRGDWIANPATPFPAGWQVCEASGKRFWVSDLVRRQQGKS